MRSLNLLVVVAVAISACATGLTVSQRFVSDVDVTGWQNYAWAKAERSTSDPRTDAANNLIRREVDSRLASMGYNRTSTDSADFLVSHSIYAHWEIEEMSDRDLEAIAEQAMMTGERATALDYGEREHGEGALYLFFAQPGGKVVWQGQVDTPLNYRGQGASKIPAAVQQLLADFPSGFDTRH